MAWVKIEEIPPAEPLLDVPRCGVSAPVGLDNVVSVIIETNNKRTVELILIKLRLKNSKAVFQMPIETKVLLFSKKVSAIFSTSLWFKCGMPSKFIAELLDVFVLFCCWFFFSIRRFFITW